jgi:hypothetical protein
LWYIRNFKTLGSRDCMSRCTISWCRETTPRSTRSGHSLDTLRMCPYVPQCALKWYRFVEGCGFEGSVIKEQARLYWPRSVTLLRLGSCAGDRLRSSRDPSSSSSSSYCPRYRSSSVVHGYTALSVSRPSRAGMNAVTCDEQSRQQSRMCASTFGMPQQDTKR